MVKQQCGYLNVCVYYSTSMENNYFYFWAKKGPPDLFSTHVHVASKKKRVLFYIYIFFNTGTCSTVHVCTNRSTCVRHVHTCTPVM